MLKKKSDKMKTAIKKVKNKTEFSFDKQGNIILGGKIKKTTQQKRKPKTKNDNIADMLAQIRAEAERD